MNVLQSTYQTAEYTLVKLVTRHLTARKELQNSLDESIRIKSPPPFIDISNFALDKAQTVTVQKLKFQINNMIKDLDKNRFIHQTTFNHLSTKGITHLHDFPKQKLSELLHHMLAQWMFDILKSVNSKLSLQPKIHLKSTNKCQ